MYILIVTGSLLDTIPETKVHSAERRRSGDLAVTRFRPGLELLSGHRDRDKPSLGAHFGVKKLFPLNRSITTIPEDFQTPSQEETE